MTRLPGKTFRQPIGRWPRHRAVRLDLTAYSRYPDSGGGRDARATVDFHALNGEGEAAFRRGVHRALDEALDRIMERLPATGDEWIVWRTTNPQAYTVAHRVARRTPSVLRTVCMAVNNDPDLRVSGGDLFKGLIVGTEQLAKNWGYCRACQAGVTWASPEGEALFQTMVQS